MKTKLLLGIGLLAAMVVAGSLWLNRAPFQGQTEPVYFILSKIEPVDSATGQSLDLVAEYAFMASMFIEMGNAMEQAVADGYLRVDPTARTATFAALGTEITAALPDGDAETAFDPRNTGAAPTFLSYGATEDTMFIRALAQTSISEDVSFRMTFTRATDSVESRIARQSTLRRERADAIATWNAKMDAAIANIDSDLTLPNTSYRLPMPGDHATMAVPVNAGYGEFGRYGRIEIIDVVTGETLFKIRPQTLDKLSNGFQADRNSFMEKPDADTRLLFEDENTLLVARRTQPFYFVKTVTVEDYAFAIFGFFDTLDDAKLAWASALSISNAAPDPGATVPARDFDAVEWFATHGAQVSAVSQFNRDLATDLQEAIAPRIKPQGLMSRRGPFSGMARVISQIDGGEEVRTHAEVPYFCSFRTETMDAPSAQHEAHINAVFLGTPRNRALEWWAQYIESGTFVSGEQFQHDPQKTLIRGPQTWLYETPSQAFGFEERLYHASSARAFGPLQLVCSTISEQPVIARAVLQLLDRISLPSSSDLSPEAISLFARYASASPVGNDLFEVKDEPDGTYSLIDKNGNQLSDRPFTWSWDYDDHRAFNTKDEAGKYALWSFTGEQLLPYEYDGFDDEQNGIIEVFKDGETLYYSVPKRAFVAKP